MEFKEGYFIEDLLSHLTGKERDMIERVIDKRMEELFEVDNLKEKSIARKITTYIFLSEFRIRQALKTYVKYDFKNHKSNLKEIILDDIDTAFAVSLRKYIIKKQFFTEQTYEREN